MSIAHTVSAQDSQASPPATEQPTPEDQTEAPTEPIESEQVPSDDPETQTSEAPAVEGSAAPVETTSAPPVVTSHEPKNPLTYGLWVLAPAFVAILLAIFTRQVVPALVAGVIVGSFMMVPCLSSGEAFADANSVIAGVRLAAETYLLGEIVDPDADFGHAKIIMFTLIIGFTVGVIARNGGTAGMVRLVAGKTESRRRGALTAWLAGLVVFFDDYANTMIVGPTMGPVFDRLKLSRAKLAYIVDSTAAPVASIAIIGTWVGAEISYIDDGLKQLAATGTPQFLDGVNGMSAFISSLAYRFYPILALVLVFFVCLTGRDFGPMKRSERKRMSETEPESAAPLAGSISSHGTGGAVVGEPAARWWLGVVPILVLVGMTIAVLAVGGYRGTAPEELAGEVWWSQGATIVGNADSYVAILYGAIISAFVAILLTLLARACPTKDAVDAGLQGMARMFPAIVILILAWALSQVSQDLKLGEVAKGYLEASNFSVAYVPLAVFISSALISFATGTSWATMGILCPVTVTITAGMVGDLPADQALVIFYAAVGSVLAGSIFGDHCSPISDTTVLSSIASGCPHEEHVWTQIPYAFVTAIVAIAASEIVCDMYDQPWYLGLAAGTVVLFLIVLVFGRSAGPRPDLATT